MQKQTEGSVVYGGDIRLQAGSRADEWILVDVRTPAELQEVHIPGSLNRPLPDLNDFLPELRAQAARKPVALVCRTGQRAEVAFSQFAKAGLENVRVLHGGITSWIEEGYPVNRGRKAISIERQVRIGAGGLVATGVALGVFVNPRFLMVPAFVGTGLVFAGITDICAMGVLLARLPFNRAPRVTSCSATSTETP